MILFSITHSVMSTYFLIGTGKTLVAKAVATECGLPFLSVKGPELLGSYVGESEANVRSTFMQARVLAKQNHPKKACILFFDELDSLAPRRGDSASGGNVMDRVVATFFSELDNQSISIHEIMDGNNDIHQENKMHIFFIGATNRPDLLDPALLRPGRIDRLIYLGLAPSDHADILFAQIRKLRLADDPRIMVNAILPLIPANVTGADLSTIATGALQRATERLCDEADKELLLRKQEQPDESLTIDIILDSWSEDRLTPVVTLDDLTLAAKDVSPSVSVKEQEKFEKLSKQFRQEVE
jgi:peroxin-6